MTDTPEKIIDDLKSLYKRMESVSRNYAYMWDDAMQELDETIALTGKAYTDWQDNLPCEDGYAEHNTMNNVYQGTK